MDLNSKIWVAGHRGMVGSAIVRRLESLGYKNIITRTSKELDLRIQLDVEKFFELERPEYVFLGAAKVGGIMSNNTYRADFLYENLMIESNVIHSSHLYGVKKLLFLGSSCIYPKLAEQPLKEESLLSGYLEPTNEPYAIAKIAGLKLCENYYRQYGDLFISCMPTNLYGPNDNYDLYNSHVLPALIRKFHEAKVGGLSSVEVWGTGLPYREFLHVDDLADACVFLMNNYDKAEFINVGSDVEITIKDLSELIKEAAGFQGNVLWDTSLPNGTPLRKLDNSKLFSLGWSPKTSFADGLAKTIQWYKENEANK
jgi:GDP-L-fucose synthase